MLRHPLQKSYTDPQNTADKWVTRDLNDRVIVSVADLLQDRLENIA
jgi:glycine cleavage system H lipoate-binding protein